jgi:hypothetical protein
VRRAPPGGAERLQPLPRLARRPPLAPVRLTWTP